MNGKFQSLALGALALACATAFAQPGRGPDRNHDRRGGPQMHGPGPDRHMDRRGPQYGAAQYPQYHRYNRGDRLPPQYRRPQYVVNDWRGHGLRQPPRGYYWVQNGSDYVLAAVATGLISAVVINALNQ